MCSADVFLAVLALLFPPLPVWVKCGICSADSLINILLCVLGYVPGLIHAWYIIAKYPEPPFEYEALPPTERDSSGRVTYVYVQCPQGAQDHHQQHQAQAQAKQAPAPEGGMNYGTQSPPGSAHAPANQSHPQEQGVMAAGEGSSEHQGVPPSYAEVVAGDHHDHKIQHD